MRVIFALLLLTTSAIFGDELRDKLNKCYHDARSSDKAKQQQAIDTCRGIMNDKALNDKTTFRAAEILLRAYDRRKDWEEFTETARLIVERYQDKEMRQEGYQKLFEGRLRQKNWDAAKKVIAEFKEEYPADKDRWQRYRLRYLWYLRHRKRDQDEALAYAREIADFQTGDDKLMSDTLMELFRCADSKRDLDLMLATYHKIRNENYFELRRKNERDWLRLKYIEIQERKKNYEEIRRFAREQLKTEKEPETRQRFALEIAKSYYREEKFQEALNAAEEVFVLAPESMKRWYEAQRLICDSLIRMNKNKEAISAMQIGINTGYHRRDVEHYAKNIAKLLVELDKKDVTRANDFMTYLLHGEYGEDGKPNTDDDVKNPLKSFPLPKYPKRTAALETIRKQLGHSAQDFYYRAISHQFCGEPVEAFANLVEATRRARLFQKSDYSYTLCFRGIRPLIGSFYRFEDICAFVRYGEDGEDGKAGTADDKKDIVAALLKKHRIRPVQYPKKDADILKEAQLVCREWINHPYQSWRERRPAFEALARTHEILLDWGGQTQIEWYKSFLPKMEHRDDFEVCMPGLLSAYNANAYHLGSSQEFWHRLNTGTFDVPKDLQNEVQKMLKNWERHTKSFTKVEREIPRLKLYKVQKKKRKR